MDIKFTDAERVLLANQYAILGHLEDSSDYKRLSQNLRDGHEYLYRDLFNWISPEMDRQTTQFVLDALSMYQAINDSWITLGSPSDIKAQDVKWPGFDGNNEGTLYSFSCALAQDNRFEDQLGERGVNSHSEMTSTYRKMLAKWRDLGAPRHPMSSDEIKTVLAARGY